MRWRNSDWGAACPAHTGPVVISHMPSLVISELCRRRIYGRMQHTADWADAFVTYAEALSDSKNASHLNCIHVHPM